MLAYPNEHRPAFSEVPQALQSRHYNELAAQLAAEGIRIVGESNGAFQLDLTELAQRAGTLERGRANLYAALDGLNIARVDLSPSDVTNIMGRDALWFGVARGLEAGVPSIVNLLREATPDELFDRLDKAASFVLSDRTEESDEHGRWLASQLKQAAAVDLKNNGLLDGDTTDSYRNWMEPPVEVVRELPEEYRDESVKPYQSPFNDGGF